LILFRGIMNVIALDAVVAPAARFCQKGSTRGFRTESQKASDAGRQAARAIPRDHCRKAYQGSKSRSRAEKDPAGQATGKNMQ
jgi:hypothetical protein